MATAIRDILPALMRHVSTTQQLLDQVRTRWARIVGKPLASHTAPVQLRRGLLTVQTDEPGASFALSLERPRVLEALREASGGRITDFVVRAGGKAS